MRKNKKTAALLALFGGMFGIHKFYLNEPGVGIFYTILTIMTQGFFPVAAMLGVFDAIRLFQMSTEKFDAKYNKGHSSRVNRQDQRTQRGRNRDTRQDRDLQMERNKSRNKKIISKQRNNPFRKSADKKFLEYDLEGALEDYDRAQEIGPADKDMHFNLACIYSLKENTDKSIFHLDASIKAGYKNVENIKTKDELAYLRIQPAYDAFVAAGYKKLSDYKPKNAQKEVEPPKDGLLQGDFLLAQLNKLKEMRSRGLLSDAEFSYEKEKLTKRR